MTTYIEDLVEVLAQAGDRPVLRHEGTDTTGAALLAEIRRTARALDGLGIGRGDLVALLAPNTPEALAVRYAAHLIGAAACYLSVPPDPQRRAAMIAQFAPRLVVVFPETADLLPPVDAVVASVGAGVGLRLDELAAPESDAPLQCRARPADLAVLISSGGTTGVPKGSRRDFARYSAMTATPPDPARRQLANGKLAYLTQVLVDQTLLGGGLVVLQDHYEPEATLAAVARERITHLFLVEPQLFGLMDHPGVAAADLSSLQAVTHIGAMAAPVLRQRARRMLGPVVMHTYGASEIGIVSALPPAEHDRPSRFWCAGRIVPGVGVRFRAADGTLDRRAGAIEVRSPAMAQGYTNRPVEEAEHFVDGWYRTGDYGCLDEEDMLRILGRRSDIGELGAVTPVELQDTLCRLPSVRYAVLVADPETGVRIAAAQAWPGGAVDVADCRAAVAARYGEAVAASLQVVPMVAIPLTEQGKPDRVAIRQSAAARC
ncbi:class I adenylate-forming enzyme family protein [Pseudonocardia sp. WMMC193]|uniref:class I adenylate-forming enzyme family protein n=1 Tax=Pseudonocardia sp. WMMC193 TaxID=2911965 RepID=UPI001F330B7C|nr:AMP-binding protein [Pseudonocardia sp. WMMC193]MCF7552764.1 AMP-binding protein [Pseudonocardia sp. WMMC193]